ncbi:MAG: RNA polymerase sigma factor (sigma-70 family) [Marivirga sp.]
MSKQNTIEKEQELIKGYKETASLEILGKLYAPYMHLVYGLCLKYLKEPSDAQDAVMTIFESLIEKLIKHEVIHFKSWLYVLSKNHCLMEIRRSKKSALQHIGDYSESFMENQYHLHPINESIPEEDNIERLNVCIEQLKSTQKECVEMFYIEKKSYQEIVKITSYELKKVKSAIQNGKRNLKSCMESSE